MAKKNKDGLIGGELVSEKDHLKTITRKRKKAALDAKVKAEKAAEVAAESAQD